MPENETQGWRIDKRIPLHMLGAMAINVAALIWFASQIEFRLTDLENFRTQAETNFERIASDNDGISVRLTHLEDEEDNILDSVKSIQTHFPSEDYK
jgi:hypothetical protein